MENTVTEKCVEEAIQSEEYVTLGKKTTVCIITLKDGFEVIGSSACVFADNYDIEKGKPFARERALQLVWSHLGSILQAKMLVNKIDEACEEKACCDEEACTDSLEPISA